MRASLDKNWEQTGC